MLLDSGDDAEYPCGPDFRVQMINSECEKLDAIFFTHEHNDHVSGLDDIRPFYFKQRDVPIYASNRVINALTKRFEYIFKSSGRINLSIFKYINLTKTISTKWENDY